MLEYLGWGAIGLMFLGAAYYVLFVREDQFDRYNKKATLPKKG